MSKNHKKFIISFALLSSILSFTNSMENQPPQRQDDQSDKSTQSDIVMIKYKLHGPESEQSLNINNSFINDPEYIDAMIDIMQCIILDGTVEEKGQSIYVDFCTSKINKIINQKIENKNLSLHQMAALSKLNPYIKREKNESLYDKYYNVMSKVAHQHSCQVSSGLADSDVIFVLKVYFEMFIERLHNTQNATEEQTFISIIDMNVDTQEQDETKKASIEAFNKYINLKLERGINPSVKDQEIMNKIKEDK